MSTLSELGFCESFWQESLPTPPQICARVIGEERGRLLLAGNGRSFSAVVAGRLADAATDRAMLPTVGDFVFATPPPVGEGLGRVERVLRRKTSLRRKIVGGTDGQVVAANVDVVLIVTSLNREFNERRLERYLAAVWESGASPMLVATKVDLIADVAPWEHRLRSVAGGAAAPVHFVSGLSGQGMEGLRGLSVPGRTLAFVGSSGVGKSTLVNRLLETEAQSVSAISDSGDKGRHTTTSRSLLLLPGGGILIDTPGMREFMPVDGESALGLVFEDIEVLVTQCRFSNCTHRTEPDCAVREAIQAGALLPERWQSHEKLMREQARLARRRDGRAQALERQALKRRMRAYRHERKRSW